ncbi:MAG TPA: peptidoglycan editing factor PgeF [Chloroflexia bacterium]
MRTPTISSSDSASGRNPAHPAGVPVRDGIYSVLALRPYTALLHGISTRLSPEGTDWNLSARRGTPANPPDPEVAQANRGSLARRLGISLDRMVGCQQVHGNEVALVGDGDAGKGMLPGQPGIPDCDAMITATPGLYLMALSADCPPVFFYDPAHRAIGLAHSGWKGTVARISASVVESMGRHFGSRPEDIVAVVGPGIGPCCYKVGPSVVEAVESAYSRPWSVRLPLLELYEGEVYFNLWEGIRRALVEAGVPPRNVAVDGLCTMHNTGIFYSHRGEAGQCGLFGAVLGLRE